MMAKKDPLKEYRAKRNFRRSPEPSGRRRKKPGEVPIFVIQKHAVPRNRHYDLRLEVDGVLKSWAVPKGPSIDPREKRAAFATEDHPLEYAEFEGVIPEGEHGGGIMMVWDRGTYRNLTEKNAKKIPIKQALKRGHANIWLDAQKVKGGYSLTRIAKGEKERWLLVKMKDEDADARRNPIKSMPDSVLTSRSLKEIEKDESE